MKYRAKERTFHDGVYFYEGDEIDFPDGYEPSASFEPVSKRVLERSEKDRTDAIDTATQSEIKRLSLQLRFGGGALMKLYEKAGAKTDGQKLEALKEYMARKQE